MLKIAWAPNYHHPLPQGHRFPMEKYSLIPKQLLLEGVVEDANFFVPEPVGKQQILAVHAADYWARLETGTLSVKEVRKIGFPYAKTLVNRELMICGGTLQNALQALENGCAMNVAGGTHHAHRDFGAGFCLLNDIAIAAQFLLDQQLVKQILVVDLDVHQGDGTASIFAEETRVFTFSMHAANNFPLKKSISNLDIALADGVADAEYLRMLNDNLNRLISGIQPDFIFYQSGVDVLKSDKLGRLSLSIAGCKARDKVVFEACRANGIPIAVSMGGGYSERLATIIEAHANTFRLARDIFF